MADRRDLMRTAGVGSGLLDAAGNPLPRSTVEIAIKDLPKIERAALPGLPHDMEGRLLNVDDEPRVVLFCPRSELHVEVPLTDLENLARYVAALKVARAKQGMGEPPEGEGYRVDG